MKFEKWKKWSRRALKRFGRIEIKEDNDSNITGLKKVLLVRITQYLLKLNVGVNKNKCHRMRLTSYGEWSSIDGNDKDDMFYYILYLINLIRKPRSFH